jgi:hypothetical protein
LHLLIIDLEGNSIGDNGVAVLCHLMCWGHLPALTHLLIASNGVTRRGVELIAETLEPAQGDADGGGEGHRLSVLGLSNNCLTDDSVLALCRIVRACGSVLHRLFLHHTGLTGSGLRAVLEEVEAEWSTCDHRNSVFAAQNVCDSVEYASLSARFKFLRL